MQSPLFRLKSLPEKIAAVAGQVTASSRDIVAISLERFVRMPLGWPETLFMKRVQLRWHFFFARRRTGMFFFWKKGSLEQIVLDADLDMTVVPGESFERGPSITMEGIEYCFVLPPFVRIDRTAELLASIGLPEASPSNCIVLELGPGEQDLLAIKDPRKGVDGATITYTRFGKTVRVLPERIDRQRLWRPQPFIALFEAIRAWFLGGEGDVLPIRPPPNSRQSDVWKMLLQLVSAYVQSSQAIDERQPPPDGKLELVDELGVRYDIGRFESRIILRLTPEGEIAVEDEDDPFHLRLTLSMRREPRGASALVDVRPPDFLAGGDLREAFLDALDGAPGELSSVLGAKEAEARRFLREGRDSAVVFRVRWERDKDTDVIVLDGILDGTCVVAMLRGDFSVKATNSDPPAVELLSGTLEALFVGPSQMDEPVLPKDVVGYVLQFAAEIQKWLAVVV